MSSPDSRSLRLTRRRALAGAAWTAPVVVAVSAAPAYAASPGTSLSLLPGGSGAVLTTDGVDSYYDLQFSGMSVIVPTALSAGQLTLTVTYTPATPGGPSTMLVVDDPGPTFTISPVEGTASSVVLTYAGAVTPGTEVPVPSGSFVGANAPSSVQTGSYVVTAAAPGLASDARVFTTPSSRAARGMTAVPRPGA
jgi:hypothetical protein